MNLFEPDLASVVNLMPQKDEIGQLLGTTAYWTASVRAMESKRDDRLISDQWAEILAGDVGAEWIKQRTADAVLPIVLRTRYFDDFLQRIAYQSGIRQVVLMAAGLDTRAFRLSWPESTRIFELDQPEVMQYKNQILSTDTAKPNCERHVIAVDLTGHWLDRLTDAGLDLRQPSAWLLEGFLFYLPEELITRLLAEIALSASGASWLGFDVINSFMLTSPYTRSWIEMQAKAGAPWIGTLDDPIGFLNQYGWQGTMTQAGQMDANYGRWTLPVLPTMMPEFPHNWFVTACKR